MQTTTDVCIIGAGPAGLIASLFLSEENINHTIVEKSEFPRHKPCADILTSHAVRILNEIDPYFLKELKKNNEALPIGGTILYPSEKNSIDFDFLPLDGEQGNPSCYAISRHDLDHKLYELATENTQANFITNFEVGEIKKNSECVTITNTSRTTSIEAKLVIVATGSNASLSYSFAQYKKNPQHIALGIRGYFSGIKNLEKDNYTELYLSKEMMPGGFYIAPLPKGLANVNMVIRNDAISKKAINMNKLFKEQIEKHPLIHDRLQGAQLEGNLQGSSLFLGTQKRKIAGERYMMAGDAAGLIDLISANGIPQAMLSGKLAAMQAKMCIAKDDFSESEISIYEKRLYKKIENDLYIGRKLSPWLSYGAFNTLMLGTIQFLAKRAEKNHMLRDLLYDNEVEKTLRKPSFYYQLLFG